MKNVLTEKKHVLVEEQNREKEQMTDKEKCVLLKRKTKNRNKNRHILFCMPYCFQWPTFPVSHHSVHSV